MKITTLSQFKDNFNTVYSEAIDKKTSIEHEINEIEHFVNTIAPSMNLKRAFRASKVPTDYRNSNAAFNKLLKDKSSKLFSDAFNQYHLFGNYNLEKLHSDTDEMYQFKNEILKQAYEFSEYYKWLKGLLNSNQKTVKKNELTLNQKVLALDYLGLDFNSEDKTKMANVLSAILGMNEQNIRECLTYINLSKNEIRTKKNLEALHNIFNNQGFIKINSALQRDIDAFEK